MFSVLCLLLGRSMIFLLPPRQGCCFCFNEAVLFRVYVALPFPCWRGSLLASRRTPAHGRLLIQTETVRKSYLVLLEIQSLQIVAAAAAAAAAASV